MTKCADSLAFRTWCCCPVVSNMWSTVQCLFGLFIFLGWSAWKQSSQGWHSDSVSRRLRKPWLWRWIDNVPAGRDLTSVWALRRLLEWLERAHRPQINKCAHISREVTMATRAHLSSLSYRQYNNRFQGQKCHFFGKEKMYFIDKAVWVYTHAKACAHMPLWEQLHLQYLLTNYHENNL